MDLDSTHPTAHDRGNESYASQQMDMARDARGKPCNMGKDRDRSDERPMAVKRGGEGRAGGIPLN